MSLIATSGGAAVPLLPEDTYLATCYLLADIGTQHSKNKGFKPAHKVIIGWEVADEYVDIGGEQTPRTIYNIYTMSLNEKSKLRKDLIAWRGRDFTPEELKAFDLRNIVGVPCQIQIVHTTQDGETYANIAGLMKLPKFTPCPETQLPQQVYDIDDNPVSDVDRLPKWIAEKVKASEEFKLRTLPANGEAPTFTELPEDGELPF